MGRGGISARSGGRCARRAQQCFAFLFQCLTRASTEAATNSEEEPAAVANGSSGQRMALFPFKVLLSKGLNKRVGVIRTV